MVVTEDLKSSGFGRAGSSPARGTKHMIEDLNMVTGWVLFIVLSNGLQPSTLTTQYGFATETECKTVATKVVYPPDRWKCFKSTR